MRVRLLPADCSAVTRDPGKCHRRRGADGERAGEAGENVLETGRVQASKLDEKRMSKHGISRKDGAEF